MNRCTTRLSLTAAWRTLEPTHLPDIDGVGLLLGAPARLGSAGQRGFTHSLVFAALLGAVLAAVTAPDADGPADCGGRRRLWLGRAQFDHRR